MQDQVDAFRYIGYLGKRWRFVVWSAALATVAVLGINLLLPSRYTATARIVIEPPAGTDQRSSMAVSPIYLESLRTYERFADSETLFTQSLDRFHLRERLGFRPIESLKKQILRTEIVRNTKILEISATLPNPRDAQTLAQYVAQRTVALSQSVTQQGDRDLLAGFETERAQAKARMERSEAAWKNLAVTEPVEGLQSEIQSSGSLRQKITELILSTELEIADSAVAAPREIESARRRLTAMRQQLSKLDREIASKEAMLATRQAHRDALQAERKADEAGWAAAEAKLRDARYESGYRGERLRIIDPGVVPERPSSPNVPLNVTVAFLLAVLASLCYLAIELNYREFRRPPLAEVPRLTRRAGDD
jgi:uncharacterized protein involved in exopolysaccharide biosynthesis